MSSRRRWRSLPRAICALTAAPAFTSACRCCCRSCPTSWCSASPFATFSTSPPRNGASSRCRMRSTSCASRACCSLTLLVLDYVLVAPNVRGAFFFGKVTIVLYWFLEVSFLSALRFAYRYFRYTRVRHHAREEDAAPALLIGRAADAEILLRGIESRRGEAHLAGRHAVAVGCRSRPAHPQHSGARRDRRHRGRDLGLFTAQQADRARGDDAVGLRGGRASGIGPDAGQASRPDRQPPAVAGERGCAAPRAGRGRGPAAAAERKDRLCAAGSAGEGQGRDRHRRRRLDRLGNLSPCRDIRRRAASGARKFRARALRHHRGARSASAPAPSSTAGSPTSATAGASFG